jgi:hypothetical protein
MAAPKAGVAVAQGPVFVALWRFHTGKRVGRVWPTLAIYEAIQAVSIQMVVHARLPSIVRGLAAVVRSCLTTMVVGLSWARRSEESCQRYSSKLSSQSAAARPMIIVPQLPHRACLQLVGHALGKPFDLPTPAQITQQMQLLEHKDLEQGALQAGRWEASCVAGAGCCALWV